MRLVQSPPKSQERLHILALLAASRLPTQAASVVKLPSGSVVVRASSEAVARTLVRNLMHPAVELDVCISVEPYADEGYTHRIILAEVR